MQVIKDNYATFAVPYNGDDNNDYVDGKGFCCNGGSLEAAQAQALSRAAKNNFQEGDAYEKMQFYYHPNHLGSSSYITNLDGEVVQHIEYVPFGEVLYSESESYSYMNNRGQRVMETLSKEEAATVGLNHVKKMILQKMTFVKIKD